MNFGDTKFMYLCIYVCTYVLFVQNLVGLIYRSDCISWSLYLLLMCYFILTLTISFQLRLWALSIALRQILRKQDAGTIKTVDELGSLSVNFQFWGDVVSKTRFKIYDKTCTYPIYFLMLFTKINKNSLVGAH